MTKLFEAFKKYHNANHHDGENHFDDEVYRKSNGEDFDNPFVQECFDYFEAAWQEQQKVIAELESHQEKQSECIKNLVSQRNSASSRVESSLISIEKFFDDQVQNPTLRQYANFIQEIYETLRGEP